MKSHSKLLLLVIAAAGSQAEVVIGRVADDFRWIDPFGAHSTPLGFEATCEATATFHATQHVLRDLTSPPPVGLAPWADALKFFFGGRPFPGSWDGVDNGGTNRDVLMMEYTDVPRIVRSWIQEQKDKESDTKWLFAVYEKAKGGKKIRGTAKLNATPAVGENEEDAAGPADEDLIVLFAAGAIYENLPLWVAEGSECEVALRDVGKYHAVPQDGMVVAWPLQRTEPDWNSDNRDITFKIKAQVLKETNEGKVARLAREHEEAQNAAQIEEEAEAEVHAEDKASSETTEKDEL